MKTPAGSEGLEIMITVYYIFNIQLVKPGSLDGEKKVPENP